VSPYAARERDPDKRNAEVRVELRDDFVVGSIKDLVPLDEEA
jgi:hypothetical protein